MTRIDPKAFGSYQDLLRADVPLSSLSYSLCGGPCAYLAEPSDPALLTVTGHFKEYLLFFFETVMNLAVIFA